MISSLLPLVGLRPRVYYTLTNFRGGAPPPLNTPMGSELWNLNCRYVDEFKVAWRKVKRRIWRLPSNTHNIIIQNLTYNIDDQLDARMAKFIYMCLNHDNDVCRSI